MNKLKLTLIYTILSLNFILIADQNQLKTDINWETFLKRHDLVWDTMPKEWNQAPFLGNGMLGSMVIQSNKNTVRWEIGRGDVQDHRPAGKKFGFDTCRLPIGNFELKTVGKIIDGTMRLELWNAEANGLIQTSNGEIKWQTIVHSDRNLIMIILESSVGEKACKWQWKALPAVSPRLSHGRKPRGKYQYNPEPVETKQGDISVCTQNLLSGGQTATAWQEVRQGNKSILKISVDHSFPDSNAQRNAVDEVKQSISISKQELLQSHRSWWHNYYPASFVSFTDTYWESFYWIQMYKLASATRSDRMLIDNTGPWIQVTPWPGAWWNLNVQLSYWPTYASNRHHLSQSLDRTLFENIDTLISNVPKEFQHNSAGLPRASGQDCAGPIQAPNGTNTPELGLLLWACHNTWLHYRHTMNDETLRNNIFPLLKRAVNFHMHFLKEGEDGRLHLPKTFSPEYMKHGPDCNFDLALLRWGCETLIKINKRLKLDDDLKPAWQKVLNKLTDYPTGENGYLIAKDVPFDKGHRHYSHLLMFYPLYLVNRNQTGAEELMLKSVGHWQSMGGRQGYSLTGASSISSAFGRGNDALGYLNELKPFLQVNTLYKEAGPVIETPLSGAQSIHDMLIQSWGDTIRVFPAIADAWPDVAIHDISTQGAFLISAKRQAGKTVFVRIKSLAGEPCLIEPNLGGEIKVHGDRQFELKEVTPGKYSLDIKKGEDIILYTGDELPNLSLSPVDTIPKNSNAFGLKK